MADPLSAEALSPSSPHPYGLSAEDLRFFASRGKPAQHVERELTALSAAFKPSPVSAAATLQNGFLYRLHSPEVRRFLEVFTDSAATKILRFGIPTAGAASRQFQTLRSVISHPRLMNCITFDEVMTAASSTTEQLSKKDKPLSDSDAATLKVMKDVVENLPRFWNIGIKQGKYAFCAALDHALTKGDQPNLASCIEKNDVRTVAQFLLTRDGLNYGFLPKALMDYHTYPAEAGRTEIRQPFEEHIRTAAQLLSGATELGIHFIISKEHETFFAEKLAELKKKPELITCLKRFGFSVEQLKVTWDFQDDSTDSVAIDKASGHIARDERGQPLLRKAGHGALVINLSAQTCDGLWMQNVDNALYDNPQIRSLVVTYKKILAGLAFDLETQSHEFLRELDALLDRTEGDVALNQRIAQFIRNRLLIEIPPDAIADKSPFEVGTIYFSILNRPIITAAFVPLAPGQAGGGPFVYNAEILPGVNVKKVGIFEGSEFEHGQKNPIFNNGEFFNPVNIFITRRDFKGALFDLTAFTDHSRSFVSSKTDTLGNPISAYELPGCWNGGMGAANMVAIPSPANTFSAVKDCAGPESFLAALHHSYDGPLFTDLDDSREVADLALKMTVSLELNAMSAQN